jgi:hypothetical protein
MQLDLGRPDVDRLRIAWQGRCHRRRNRCTGPRDHRILSGIDPVLLPESLSDIKLGASAKLYLGFFEPDSLTLVSTPVCLFAGIVDQPSVNMDPASGKVTISLNIESSLIRLQRACNLMFTPADQKIDHPDDTGLDQVNLLNWQALAWGTN